MADDQDANRDDGQRDGYELAGQIRFAYRDRRWIMVGGAEFDGGLVLELIVQAPDSDEMVKRYQVLLPLRVDGDDLVLGELEARRA